MTNPGSLKVCRILRFSLTSADAKKLAGFYEQAFGFRSMSKHRHSGTGFERIMGVQGGATSLRLTLGKEEVELLEYDSPGRSYPAHATAADPAFQHLAIVVSNMEAAYRRLLSVRGWNPISTTTHEHLPETSGNVTAFKFRDPEGHPLELLAFPEDSTPARWRTAGLDELFLGIDHSAISVRNSASSLEFYRGLGLHVSAQTINKGHEQQLLDGLHHPEVEVTALSLPAEGPHLELLCYRSSAHVEAADLCNNDIAATRTIFGAGPAGPAGPTQRCLCDPDGHRVQLVYTSGDKLRTASGTRLDV